jgi:hypothetical protein
MSTPASDSFQDNSTAQTETVAGFSIRDTATATDKLGFDAYVEAVAAFLTNEGTEPPLTMSIEGEWGSGKSSFMLLLETAIKDDYKRSGRQAKTVWFNAWRFDKDEALWAAFALLITNSLAKRLPFSKRAQAHWTLQKQRFDWKRGWFPVVRFILLSLFLAYTTIALGRHLIKDPDAINPFSKSVTSTSGATTNTPNDHQSPPSAKEPSPEEALLKLTLTGAGGVGSLLLLAMLVKKATDAIGNPFAIDLKKFSGSLNYEERISFIEQFHADFAKILKVYAEGQTVFVFIDDLDRCELPRAADMMQTINLLMSDTCKVVYVLGLDRDKIAAGLASKYEKLLTYLGSARGGTNAESSAQSGLDFGFDFLEKFIQIPYQIPTPTTESISRLFSSSDGQRPTIPSTENVDRGILFETKADSTLVQQIVAMIAPSFDHNPRRMKQFVNCFRLCAITASRTGLFGPPRDAKFSRLTAEQLGKMVAICLRWPLLIVDAVSNPKLIRLLEVRATEQGSSEVIDNRTLALASYWASKPRLLSLLRYGLPEQGKPKYSLTALDLERYLQVSPPISPQQASRPADQAREPISRGESEDYLKSSSRSDDASDSRQQWIGTGFADAPVNPKGSSEQRRFPNVKR